MASITSARIFVLCCPLAVALIVILGSASGLPLRAANAQMAQASLEYKVKAAYLLNFTRYVDWPEQAFAAPDSPIQVCILGADPFGAVLERTVAGRASKGRRIAVLRLNQLDERSVSCHVVFLSQPESQRVPALMAMVDSKPVLTVGESTDFLIAGGMINFVLKSGNVHFEINTGAVEKASLKISSRMMPLALRVISNGGTAK